MSLVVHETAWLAGTLRAWHLAILRYAVTLDNADRLAVLQDRPRDRRAPSAAGRQHWSLNSFVAPARSSARRSCNQPNGLQRSCSNIWPGLTMIVSSGPLRRRSTPASRPFSPVSSARPTAQSTYGGRFLRSDRLSAMSAGSLYFHYAMHRRLISHSHGAACTSWTLSSTRRPRWPRSLSIPHERAAGRLETVLIAVGERTDPPVGYQMLQATTGAESRPRAGGRS